MRKLLVPIFLLAAFSMVFGQPGTSPTPTPTPVPSKDLPCKFTDYRIPKKDKLYLYCDGARIFMGPKTTTVPDEALAQLMARYDLYNFSAKASLYELNDDSAVLPAIDPKVNVVMVTPTSGAASQFWMEIPFTKLRGGADFEVRLSGSFTLYIGNDHTTYEFTAARFRFTTKPDLSVTKTKLQTQDLFGHICLQRLGKLHDLTNNQTYSLVDTGCKDPDPDPDPDPERMSRIRLEDSSGNQPGQLSQRLELVNTEDVFDQTVGVKPAKPTPPPAPPKNKDAATWYFNFLHQAGVGGKPTWITQAKVAPVFGNLPGRFFLAPSLDVDIGQGQVGSTKTNDIINPKIGVTRLVRTQLGFWEAARFSPALSYETNRKGDKRNLLFDGDARFYFSGTLNTQAQRTKDAFLQAQLNNPDKKLIPEDVPKAFFGYTLQFFLGTELGSALSNNTVKSSDKSSKVIVPKYGITRLRPKFAATFEFGRVTTVFSFTPRYLFSKENVTREIDTLAPGGTVTKTILLSTVSGWRGYAEITVNYSLDKLGHYAFSTVYKRGSQPPNFDRVNTVQSGILVRY